MAKNGKGTNKSSTAAAKAYAKAKAGADPGQFQLREIKALSLSEYIDAEFIRQHEALADMNLVMANRHISDALKAQLAERYADRISWTKVAKREAYIPRKAHKAHEYASVADDSDINDLIHAHSDEIDWDAVSRRNSFIEPKPSFFEEFGSEISWPAFAESSYEPIRQQIIETADRQNQLDWEKISRCPRFPDGFLRENQNRIDWKAYLDVHSFAEIPPDLQNRYNVMEAVRRNPDLLSLVADKQLYAFASDSLKRYAWIDRVANGNQHTFDDTGEWIDSEDVPENEIYMTDGELEL